jgi:hypothetical protein
VDEDCLFSFFGACFNPVDYRFNGGEMIRSCSMEYYIGLLGVLCDEVLVIQIAHHGCGTRGLDAICMFFSAD